MQNIKYKMEEKDKNEIKSIKIENEPNLQDDLKSKEQDTKSKKNECKIQNPVSETNNVATTVKKEGIVKSDNHVLKSKVLEDGVTIGRVKSEGEASDFETISSVDSKYDIDDLDLSSITGDDFNVIVEIENELAFQNPEESAGRVCYRRNRSDSFFSSKSRSERFLSDYNDRRNDGFKNYRAIIEQKYGQNYSCVDMNYKNGRRDKNHYEREEFSRSRWDSFMSRNRSRSKSRARSRTRSRSKSRNRSRSRSRSWNRNRRRSRRNRKKNRDSRSRCSRSSEHCNRSQSSRSLEGNVKSKTPSYKDRKTEARPSECFDNDSSKSYPKRDSSSGKRIASHSSSVWNRLSNNRPSPKRVRRKKKSSDEKDVKNFWNNASRKKERTPFLVELERKLKEANDLKNLTKEAAKESLIPVPEIPSVSQNSSLLSSTIMPSGPDSQEKVLYPIQHPAMPMFSIDDLPLVPGPTGLPVHITVTGEQIPHDMDGRRIPVGPNGFYLPVDPTGRLFPHIVSPGNQAVPVHLTEDGVLRLPNSEPVPYGPGHQLPVNIDGSIIVIGRDSKPLYPYPNLPKEPPALLRMMNSSNANHMTSQQAATVTPQAPLTKNHQNFIIEPPKTQSRSQANVQPARTDLSLLQFVQNSSERINKADLIKKYKEKVQERNEGTFNCVEKRKKINDNSSKGGTKRSIPTKLLLKKTFKDDSCSSSCDMILDSGDSDSDLKCISKPHKGATEEIIISSDDDQDILKIVYDSKDGKTQTDKAILEDPIIKKVQRAIKSLCEKNYQPPAFGRFIISNLITEPVVKKSPNESPLVRDRVALPFLTPKAKDVSIENQSIIAEKAAVAFKFLPQKNIFEKGEKPLDFKLNQINSENCGAEKSSVFTSDFSMQCDFTSAVIKSLSSKISNLETEVTRLKNINANLLDGYRNVQAMNQKKNDQLRKNALEIEEKDSEIQTLKRCLEKRQ